jgi:hypothetical protein
MHTVISQATAGIARWAKVYKQKKTFIISGLIEGVHPLIEDPLVYVNFYLYENTWRGSEGN